MSATARVNGPAESRELRLARAAMPLIDRPSVAALAEIGIRYEAGLRRVAQTELRLLSAPLGLTPPGLRRRRRERDEVRYMHQSGLTASARFPTVNWHEGGEGDPLLLLNGWTASGLAWPERWLRALERDHRVIRVDNRGTGWSRSAPAPFTVADMADDAAAVLGALGIERAAVLGLSMGGMIAQELALRHPERVTTLTLVATMPPKAAQLPLDPAPFLASLRSPAPDQELRDYFTVMWGGFAAPGLLAEDPTALDELVTQIMARVTPRQRVLDQARAIGCWRGAHRLTRLEMPVTVVHGDRDPLIAVGNGMRLARLIPGARYVELAGAGHLLPYEAGDALLELIP